MNEILKTIGQQKTTRKLQFSNEPIVQEKIKEIQLAVLKTANASNRQSYTVICLDAEQAKGLGLAGSQTFLFCIDFSRLHGCAQKLKMTFDSGYWMQYVTALTDISMLAQSAVLAAQSLGMGTLVTNEIYHTQLDRVFDQLKLPKKHVFPMLAVCFGYSSVRESKAKGRLEVEDIFHVGTYREATDEDLERWIRYYDDHGKNMGLISNWEEKGYKHYLEWFYEKWSPVVGSRKQNEALLQELKRRSMV